MLSRRKKSRAQAQVANSVLALRSLMLFCAVFYAVLPSFTYCRCAGRLFAGSVKCCGAPCDRSLASASERGCCASRPHDSYEGERGGCKRACCRRSAPCEGGDGKRCCRVFSKSPFCVGQTSVSALASADDWRAHHITTPIERISCVGALLAFPTRKLVAAHSGAPPLYLLLRVLRN